MAENRTQNKTQPTAASVQEFLAGVEHPVRRADGYRLLDLMSGISGEQAQMWGPTIVGFGRYHYKYETGREGDVPAISFSPRKAQTTLYQVGLLDDYEDQLARLGPHTLGKGCLYIKRLDQADPAALREIIAQSYRVATST